MRQEPQLFQVNKEADHAAKAMEEVETRDKSNMLAVAGLVLVR